jgi:serine/threonine protein kinase
MSEDVPPHNDSSTLPPMGGEGDTGAALAAGTRVAEFEIRRVLGSGGFGIVYLAWDHALERDVALKEYMPGTLAGRGQGLAVSVRSQAVAETFALGLRSFVNEARMLARFDHPSLVKVYRFWEDNGTAYMVMPCYQGRTLRQVRAGMVVPPGEAACRRVLDALLSALEVLHKEGVYHRDIAPDNILLGDDGFPVLLDFGAARRVIGGSNKALTSIMKPHFAPLEQYADQSAMRQGPWTDLYALGGTVYFLITGREPVPAASRALHDDQPRLADMRLADHSPAFLAAIDWMLAIKPPERPQSVFMLRDVLDGRIPMPNRVAADRTMPGVASREVDIPTGPGDLNTGIQPQAPQPDSRTVVMAPPASATAPTPLSSTLPPPAAVPARERRPLWSSPAVLGLLLVLNVMSWWWFTRKDVPPAAPVVAVAPPGAASAASSAPPIATAAEKETILSVLPARAPRAAAGVASAPPVANAAASAATSRVAFAASAPRGIDAAASAARTGAMAATIDANSPRARCGDRNFLSMLVCVKRECEAASLHNHPECVKMREQEEAGQRMSR